MTSRTRSLTATIIFGLALAAPATASADGLPMTVDTSAGVTSVDGAFTYTADAKDGTTTVRRTLEDGDWRQHTIDGTYAVPGVALDATTSGLSHDGETLVLINPRRSFPRDETSLVVLDAEFLNVTDEINLEGDFSYDALSPDGETMYLIEYTDPRDPTSYAVRSYDLVSGTMAEAPVIDKSEPDEQMRGYPMTRVTGTGGRWEYTLYDAAGGEPFVHALDTVAAETLCIDLPWLKPRDVYRADLELMSGGAAITVAVGGGEPIATIDTGSGEAAPVGSEGAPTPAEVEEQTEPAAEAPPADEAGVADGTLLGLGAAAAALLLGLYLAAAVRGRRSA